MCKLVLRMLFGEGMARDDPVLSEVGHDQSRTCQYVFSCPFALRVALASVISVAKSAMKGRILKLTFGKYPAIHTNYIISHCTTLQ